MRKAAVKRTLKTRLAIVTVALASSVAMAGVNAGTASAAGFAHTAGAMQCGGFGFTYGGAPVGYPTISAGFRMGPANYAQNFWVRQHLYKASGGRWVDLGISTNWSFGTVTTMGAPAMYFNSGYGWETSARQTFTIFQSGSYTVRVEFQWEADEYGSPAGRAYDWASNYCTF